MLEKGLGRRPWRFRGGAGLGALLLAMGLSSMARAAVSNQMVWEKKEPNSKPSGRYQVAMAYDEYRHVVVLFGGEDAAGTRLGDTWEYGCSGAGCTPDWTLITPSGTLPCARTKSAMAWYGQSSPDHPNGSVLLFGGNSSGACGAYLHDTWLYGGDTAGGVSWTQVCSTCPPPARYDGTLVKYKSWPNGKVILFGGYHPGLEDDTWEFSGGNWTEVCVSPCTHPSARSRAGMAYDETRDRIVLFGGNAVTPLSDTWEYGCSGFGCNPWVEKTAQSILTPDGRSTTFGMVFDSERRVVVMGFGRIPNVNQGNHATWEYSPALAPESNWRPATSLTTPMEDDSAYGCKPLGPRASPGMAYDKSRKVTVLFGGVAETTTCQGQGTPVYKDETWELKSETPESVPNIVTGMGTRLDSSNQKNRPAVRSWRMECSGEPCAGTWKLKPAPGTTETGIMYTNKLAYSPYEYGVNVAVGNVGAVNPSGPVILTGAGPSPDIPSVVKGWHWYDGSQVSDISFTAYGTFRYGVKVAAGHTGCDDPGSWCTTYEQILTGPGPRSGFGPHVRGWKYNPQSGKGVVPIDNISYFAYSTPGYGVNVAAGDTDGDGYDEIVTGNGPGPDVTYAPNVKVWNYDATAIQEDGSLNLTPFISPQYKYGVNVASGNINASQGGCGNYDDIIAGTGPDPQLGLVTAYIVSDTGCLGQNRWTQTDELRPLPVNHWSGVNVSAGQFGVTDDLIVAGQVGVAGYVTNAVQGLSCCDWSIPTSPKLQRIDSFYFDSYNMFIGSTVAATHVPFAPAPLSAMQGGASDLASLVEVMLRLLVASPDSTYACDFCEDPAPGTWSVWGSDTQKAAAVSAAADLKEKIGRLGKGARDAILDDVWLLVSDPKLGVTQEGTFYELKEQIERLKEQP